MVGSREGPMPCSEDAGAVWASRYLHRSRRKRGWLKNGYGFSKKMESKCGGKWLKKSVKINGKHLYDKFYAIAKLEF